MSDVVSAYFATPPIARTVATVVFLASVFVYTGMISSYPFVFHYQFLLQFPPAIHRLVTSFLITRPQISVILDPYFIYTYLSQLERTNSKFSKKEDLIWYLMVTGSIIIVLNQIFTGAVMFLQALLIAVCYTACQDQRGASAHWFVLTIPAQLMPYCLLLLELLMAGPGALFVGLTGIVAAHLHDFLSRLYPEFGNGPNLIPTPWFLSYILRTPRVTNTSYGTSFAAPREFGGRDGPLPDSWRTKGPGRRLG